MSTRRRLGFTLVELLVVISIIVILMSILLPALKKVNVLVGQGMCARQIHVINQAFHGYGLDFNDKMPFVSGTGNLSNKHVTDPYFARSNGFGCIYEAKLIEDYHLLYCPAGVSGGRDWWHDWPRDTFIENFEILFEQRDRLVVDYSIAYTSNFPNTGYGAYPEVIVCPKDTVENLKKVYILWMADSRHPRGPMMAGQYTTHHNYKFTNFGMIDGSTRSVMDVWENEPTKAQMTRKGVRWNESCMDPYWFSNDRAKWQFWRWFGPGAGF